MNGTFESGSDRHCELDQLAVFFLERSAVVNCGAKSIISLPNLWIGFLKIFISLWQSSHETSSFFPAKRFFRIVEPVYASGQSRKMQFWFGEHAIKFANKEIQLGYFLNFRNASMPTRRIPAEKQPAEMVQRLRHRCVNGLNSSVESR